MKTPLKTVLAAALAFAPAFAPAGGTLEGTVSLGGALSYSTSTEAGSEFDLDLHGGVYAVDSVFAGGDLLVRDNEAVTVWELSALGRFHFLDPWLADEGGSIRSFSPYVGGRIGFASGDNSRKDESGAVFAARLGTDFFLTDNFAIDLYADAAIATADVYPDKSKMESTEIRVHVGVDFFF